MTTTWKTVLADKISPQLTEEIDVFETQIALRKQGKLEEKLFAETRLRRGAYGQRYDNGQRYDGEKSQTIPFPSGDLTKGPETFWDAPGMERIKVPFGGLNAEQMEVIADCAEEYSDSISHVTTRQDIQLHFVHIDDTPDMFRRLAAVGITTREACGNTVRNVTACPLAGVCRDQAFDVTPYSKALALFLLGHKDTQDFGRKFKIAFSGCTESACGLANMHDIGAVAKMRDGKRGFAFYVGGGLGAVPAQAKLFEEFVSEEELLPLSQAICRVFARLGERKNRAAARLKFLIKKLGFDEFKRLVLEERKILSSDPRWTDWIGAAHEFQERPLQETSKAVHEKTTDYEKWFSTNVYHQRQEGYAAVTVTLPLGDITSWQLRRLADLARRFVNETVRATVEQNLLFRWVALSDLPAFYQELAKLDLAEPGAESIVDVTACPGTDTCKLGISSSRGLAAVLRERLMARELQYDEAVRDMRIKVSGCFNSCGQHHCADIGFYGSSRILGGYAVPHFQVLLGGEWGENAAHYGLAIGSLPSKRIPEVVDRLLERYLRERAKGESFRLFMGRLGKKEAKAMLEDLGKAPSHDADPSFYTDWSDSREYTISDMGKGECAGEVVSLFEFDIANAEREVFEAQLQENPSAAVDLAYRAMLTAAYGLNRLRNIDAANKADQIVAEFRERYYDTQIFFDRFAGGKFAHYLFAAHESHDQTASAELAHQRVEEAQLFIEAAHACHQRLSS